MPEPPPHKRFQIHLSTAIVLMFVAGVLIWANMRQRRVSFPRGLGVQDTVSMPEYVDLTETQFLNDPVWNNWIGHRVYSYGWPRVAMRSLVPIMVRKNGDVKFLRPEIIDPDVSVNYIAGGGKDWFTFEIIINALVALVILFAVWFLCEWLIRHRASRKKA